LFAILLINGILEAQNLGKRTIVEVDVGSLFDSDGDMSLNRPNYCAIVQMEMENCHKILVQGKIDKATHSFKAVLNLEQNQPLELLITSEPTIVDEIYNYWIGGSFGIIDMYVEPGDSLYIIANKWIKWSSFSGKGAKNNPYQANYIDWPDFSGNFSDDYINFWLGKTERMYTDLKKELEQQKSEISSGYYKYLSAEYTYGYLSQKLGFISKYLESYEDSSLVNYDHVFENVKKLQKRIIPEFASSNILNDSFTYVVSYRRFVDKYMSYQLAVKTKSALQSYHWEPDKLLFEIGNEKLPLKTKEYYYAYIISQILGFPDRKEVAKPFYEKHIKEFPYSRYNEGLTKAFNSRGNISKGKHAPDFTLKDSSGKLISLSSFKGKAVCLYFHTNELESSLELHDIDIILSAFPELIRVYVYSGLDTAFFHKNAKTFPGAIHLLNTNWALAKEYNVNTIILGTDVTFYIIGKDGKIVNYFHSLSANELEFELYKLFNKNKEPAKSSSKTLLLVVLILGVLIVFAGISWLIIRWRASIIRNREEKQRKLVEMELRGIRAQMNPHFMFNSLSSIQNLMNQSKVQEANLYLSRFADLMRFVLNNSEKSQIPIADEIEAIRTYCELERLRFDFTYNIETDSKIDIYNTEIPGMLIQPYVENAILHGINNLIERKGNLNINLELTGNLLKCTIDDNGIGRKAAEELRSKKLQKTNGFGFRLAKERIDLLNSQYKQKISVSITDKFDNNGETEGTRVEICFPLGD
jgi:hypothetical protein